MPAGTRPPFHITNARGGSCEIGDSTHTYAASCGLTFAKYAVPRLNAFNDLLEACESALDKLGRGASETPVGRGLRAEAVDDLRAAIAKARGE